MKYECTTSHPPPPPKCHFPSNVVVVVVIGVEVPRFNGSLAVHRAPRGGQLHAAELVGVPGAGADHIRERERERENKV